ncbi:MAG: hypothetical protein KGH94_04870 [Candidatus Micrarchaeota archaeon]|nr:hypothetical protein [Candidatus Micrarchaeota archaeon]
MENKVECMDYMPEGMVGRIIATILIIALFVGGSLLYVAFYSSGFTLFQKIVVVIVAFIAGAALISILWVLWSAKYKRAVRVNPRRR